MFEKYRYLWMNYKRGGMKKCGRDRKREKGRNFGELVGWLVGKWMMMTSKMENNERE